MTYNKLYKYVIFYNIRHNMLMLYLDKCYEICYNLQHKIEGGHIMKNKSIFSQILMLIVLALVCVILTVVIAYLCGSAQETIFDFSNLNFANIIPVLFICGLVSCVVLGITVLFIARTIFVKTKEYFIENDGDNGGKKL